MTLRIDLWLSLQDCGLLQVQRNITSLYAIGSLKIKPQTELQPSVRQEIPPICEHGMMWCLMAFQVQKTKSQCSPDVHQYAILLHAVPYSAANDTCI